MSSIANPLTAPPVPQPSVMTTPSSSSSSSSSAAADAADTANSLSNTETFLQLLIAQLENQDPLDPADGTTFVTQLATFTGVQEDTEMKTDLDSINTAVTSLAAAVPAPAATTPPATSPVGAATLSGTPPSSGAANTPNP